MVPPALTKRGVSEAAQALSNEGRKSPTLAKERERNTHTLNNEEKSLMTDPSVVLKAAEGLNWGFVGSGRRMLGSGRRKSTAVSETIKKGNLEGEEKEVLIRSFPPKRRHSP